VFVSATPPSVSALTLLRKYCRFLENSGVLFGVVVTCAPTQSRSDPKKRSGRRIFVQVEVFSLVFVSADNNVSARLTTDIHKILGRPATCRRTKSSLPLENKSYRVGFR